MPYLLRVALAPALLAAAFARSTAQVLDSSGIPKDKESSSSPLEQHRFRHDDKAVIAVAFTPDGKSVATCGWDNLIRLWDVKTGHEIRKFQGHTDAVITIAISPDGKVLASGCNDQSVALWDLESGKEVMRLRGHTQSVGRVCFAPDGKKLASSGYDNSVRLWDLASGKELANCAGHKGTVYGLAYAPDGKTVVSGGADADVVIWDAATGKELRRIGTGGSALSALAVSPDGKTIVTGSGSIQLWEFTTGKERWKSQVLPPGDVGNPGQFWCVTFSPDGRTIASSSPDSSIKLWETATGKERKLVGKHDGGVAKVAFSPDAKLLASASHDKTGRLWDLSKMIDAPARKEKLKTEELASLWASLAEDDAAKAYEAITTFSADPDQTLPFLKKQIKPAQRKEMKVSANQLANLIADLDADNFAVREKATVELVKLGQDAGAAMRKALAGEVSTEARRRMEKLMEGLTATTMTSEDLRLIRAIEILEGVGSKDARELLKVLSKGTPEALATQEATAALARLAPPKPGK